MTVSIRLDYESERWEQKAERCLEAGAELVGIPASLLDEIETIAERTNLKLSIEEHDGAYRVSPTSTPR